MAISLGGTAITAIGKIKSGSANVLKVFLGETQIWPATSAIVRFILTSCRSDVPMVVSGQIESAGVGNNVCSASSEICAFFSRQRNFNFIASSVSLVLTIGPTNLSAVGTLTHSVIRNDNDAVIYSGSHSYSGTTGWVSTIPMTLNTAYGYRIYVSYSSVNCVV